MRLERQTGQQRRHEHADDARCRGTAQRGRNIPAGDRSEGDRRLHGRRQCAKEQKAEIKRWRQHTSRQGAQREADDRKYQECRGKDDEVQPPMQHARNNRRAGQASPLEKEQQSDGNGGHRVEEPGALPATRQHQGQQHRCQHSYREFVGA